MESKRGIRERRMEKIRQPQGAEPGRPGSRIRRIMNFPWRGQSAGTV
ncbi:hypothetical protein LJK88_12360 [Paenibacillus sp. P26]|nr:hypothetical protein LJK88_12360 [Paenibacillus sp. P26]